MESSNQSWTALPDAATEKAGGQILEGCRREKSVASESSSLGPGSMKGSHPGLPDSWSLIVAVKGEHEQVLRGNLLRSPDIDDRCQVIVKRGFQSAARAYNEGIAEARSEILVLAHSDVYLPKGWLNDLASAIGKVALADSSWAVLGVGGVTKDGGVKGHIYSTGLKRIVGEPFEGPLEASSLDEMLLVIRRSASLLFDEGLPGFHLYGTDICMEARRRSMRSFVIPAFCIHNSIGVRYLSRAFWRSYFYMRKKWWDELPVRTCCTTITKGAWPVLHHILARTRDHLVFSAGVGTRCEDVYQLYRLIAPTSRG